MSGTKVRPIATRSTLLYKTKEDCRICRNKPNLERSNKRLSNKKVGRFRTRKHRRFLGVGKPFLYVWHLIQSVFQTAGTCQWSDGHSLLQRPKSHPSRCRDRHYWSILHKTRSLSQTAEPRVGLFEEKLFHHSNWRANRQHTSFTLEKKNVSLKSICVYFD